MSSVSQISPKLHRDKRIAECLTISVFVIASAIIALLQYKKKIDIIHSKEVNITILVGSPVLLSLISLVAFEKLFPKTYQGFGVLNQRLSGFKSNGINIDLKDLEQKFRLGNRSEVSTKLFSDTNIKSLIEKIVAKNERLTLQDIEILQWIMKEKAQEKLFDNQTVAQFILLNNNQLRPWLAKTFQSTCLKEEQIVLLLSIVIKKGNLEPNDVITIQWILSSYNKNYSSYSTALKNLAPQDAAVVSEVFSNNPEYSLFACIMVSDLPLDVKKEIAKNFPKGIQELEQAIINRDFPLTYKLVEAGYSFLAHGSTKNCSLLFLFYDKYPKFDSNFYKIFLLSDPISGIPYLEEFRPLVLLHEFYGGDLRIKQFDANKLQLFEWLIEKCGSNRCFLKGKEIPTAEYLLLCNNPGIDKLLKEKEALVPIVERLSPKTSAKFVISITKRLLELEIDPVKKIGERCLFDRILENQKFVIQELYQTISPENKKRLTGYLLAKEHLTPREAKFLIDIAFQGNIRMGDYTFCEYIMIHCKNKRALKEAMSGDGSGDAALKFFQTKNGKNNTPFCQAIKDRDLERVKAYIEFGCYGFETDQWVALLLENFPLTSSQEFYRDYFPADRNFIDAFIQSKKINLEVLRWLVDVYQKKLESTGYQRTVQSSIIYTLILQDFSEINQILQSPESPLNDKNSHGTSRLAELISKAFQQSEVEIHFLQRICKLNSKVFTQKNNEGVAPIDTMLNLENRNYLRFASKLLDATRDNHHQEIVDHLFSLIEAFEQSKIKKLPLHFGEFLIKLYEIKEPTILYNHRQRTPLEYMIVRYPVLATKYIDQHMRSYLNSKIEGQSVFYQAIQKDDEELAQGILKLGFYFKKLDDQLAWVELLSTKTVEFQEKIFNSYEGTNLYHPETFRMLFLKYRTAGCNTSQGRTFAIYLKHCPKSNMEEMLGQIYDLFKSAEDRYDAYQLFLRNQQPLDFFYGEFLMAIGNLQSLDAQLVAASPIDLKIADEFITRIPNNNPWIIKEFRELYKRLKLDQPRILSEAFIQAMRVKHGSSVFSYEFPVLVQLFPLNYPLETEKEQFAANLKTFLLKETFTSFEVENLAASMLFVIKQNWTLREEICNAILHKFFTNPQLKTALSPLLDIHSKLETHYADLFFVKRVVDQALECNQLSTAIVFLNNPNKISSISYGEGLYSKALEKRDAALTKVLLTLPDPFKPIIEKHFFSCIATIPSSPYIQVLWNDARNFFKQRKDPKVFEDMFTTTDLASWKMFFTVLQDPEVNYPVGNIRTTIIFNNTQIEINLVQFAAYRGGGIDLLEMFFDKNKMFEHQYEGPTALMLAGSQGHFAEAMYLVKHLSFPKSLYKPTGSNEAPLNVVDCVLMGAKRFKNKSEPLIIIGALIEQDKEKIHVNGLETDLAAQATAAYLEYKKTQTQS